MALFRKKEKTKPDNIDAEDSTSFRASINSAIKWIKLSLEINNLTN